MIDDVAALVIAYLVGGIPTAVLVGKWLAGVDIRRHGSGNVGALNTYRAVGAKAAVLVLVVDVAKGAVVIGGVSALGPAEWAVLGSAVAVTLGHNWSPYLRFHGGKGAAVVLGASLPVVPLLAVAAFLVAIGVFAAVRSAPWGFLAGAMVLNGLLLLTDQPANVVATCFSLFALVVVTHAMRQGPELWRAVRAGDVKRLFAVE